MALSTDYVMRTGPFDPADAELRLGISVVKDGKTQQSTACKGYKSSSEDVYNIARADERQT